MVATPEAVRRVFLAAEITDILQRKLGSQGFSFKRPNLVGKGTGNEVS